MFTAFLIISGFIIFFLIGFIGMNKQKEDEKKRKEIKKSDRRNLEQFDLDFSPNKSYINPDGKMKIAFNSEKELFKIYRMSPNGMIHDIAIPFDKIVDS